MTFPTCAPIIPATKRQGGVPAIDEVKFSLVSNRGCFGACSFCALTFHQGRIVQTRSHESILREAEIMVTEQPDFKGYIHDVGGPTANFRHPACEKQLSKRRLPRAAVPVPHALQEHERRPLRTILPCFASCASSPGSKRCSSAAASASTICWRTRRTPFFRELVQYHVSGQLKVAPEHVSDAVLARMGKPRNAVYNRFVEKYFAAEPAATA